MKILKPEATDPLYAACDHCNTFVLS